MANNASRGGMKQSDARHQPGKKHQGIRPGSTATRKERHQVEKREPAIDEERERTSARRAKAIKAGAGDRQGAKAGKGPAAQKLRQAAPAERGKAKTGAAKKNAYANMPKARKVR